MELALNKLRQEEVQLTGHPVLKGLVGGCGEVVVVEGEV
jgi:hypothetical protein